MEEKEGFAFALSENEDKEAHADNKKITPSNNNDFT